MTSFGAIYVAVASTSVRARVTVAILAVSEGKRKVVVEVTPEEMTVNCAVAWGLKRALERLGDRRATLHTNLKAVVDLATTIVEHGAVERRVSAVGWWRDDPWGTPETTTDPRRRPLVRNVAMIASCEGRADTRIVGLIDAASKTRGTQHTLSIARSGGFNVTQFVWGAS